MRVERGMTFPRMMSLVELHARTTMRDLFNLGTAVAMAFSDPPALKGLIHTNTKLDMDKLPRMLRATT